MSRAPRRIGTDWLGLLAALGGFIVLAFSMAWCAGHFSSLNARASLLSTQTWSWDPVDNATSYRIYWSRYATRWCAVNRVEYPASVCVDGECQGDTPTLPYTLTFINVVAVNANGESPLDHGPQTCQ